MEKTYTVYSSYDVYSEKNMEMAKENILYNVFGEENKAILTDNFGKNVEVTKEEYLISEEDIYNECSELNNLWYCDTKRELESVDSGKGLIAIASLGLWNGRKSRYKKIDSLVNCLSTSDDSLELYVDSNGDLRRTTSHHDGDNYVLYRYWKEGLTERQKENFLLKVYNGNYTQKDITRYTCKAGLELADTFGWKVRH